MSLLLAPMEGLLDHVLRDVQFFAREAAGLTGDVPKLLRGEFI